MAAWAGWDMGWLSKTFAGLGVLIILLWVRNASIFAPSPNDGPLFIAHRGVAQTYHRDGLTNETCTAERINVPTHPHLENTLPSMAAAFAAGADVVELDIHLTADDQFAVFHDWTVDCRTNGSGRTVDHTMDELRALDAGYGYTADGGATFPFRGKGIGLIVSLDEVFSAFPGRAFLVNMKSNNAAHGEAFADFLVQHPEWVPSVWGVYGGADSVGAVKNRFRSLRTYSRQSFKACFVDYMTVGWSGYVPASCHDTVIGVPINYRRLAWGWPRTFIARMNAAGTDVIVLGPFTPGDPGSSGIDDKETLSKLPDKLSAYIWTNRIEVLGPDTVTAK